MVSLECRQVKRSIDLGALKKEFEGEATKVAESAKTTGSDLMPESGESTRVTRYNRARCDGQTAIDEIDLDARKQKRPAKKVRTWTPGPGVSSC